MEILGRGGRGGIADVLARGLEAEPIHELRLRDERYRPPLTALAVGATRWRRVH